MLCDVNHKHGCKLCMTSAFVVNSYKLNMARNVHLTGKYVVIGISTNEDYAQS
jgi:hypothetical protein